MPIIFELNLVIHDQIPVNTHENIVKGKKKFPNDDRFYGSFNKMNGLFKKIKGISKILVRLKGCNLRRIQQNCLSSQILYNY